MLEELKLWHVIQSYSHNKLAEFPWTVDEGVVVICLYHGNGGVIVKDDLNSRMNSNHHVTIWILKPLIFLYLVNVTFRMLLV